MRPPGGIEIPLEDLYAEVCRSGSSWTRCRVSVHVFMLCEAAESSITTLSANLVQALFFFFLNAQMWFVPFIRLV